MFPLFPNFDIDVTRVAGKKSGRDVLSSLSYSGCWR